MRRQKKDEFDASFSWSDKTAHVIGTPNGIVILYEIWDKATRMIFVYKGRAYGKTIEKIYSDSWEVRLARRFAQDVVNSATDA